MFARPNFGHLVESPCVQSTAPTKAGLKAASIELPSDMAEIFDGCSAALRLY